MENGPLSKVDLPIHMVIFHGYVSLPVQGRIPSRPQHQETVLLLGLCKDLLGSSQLIDGHPGWSLGGSNLSQLLALKKTVRIHRHLLIRTDTCYSLHLMWSNIILGKTGAEICISISNQRIFTRRLNLKTHHSISLHGIHEKSHQIQWESFENPWGYPMKFNQNQWNLIKNLMGFYRFIVLRGLG